MGSLLFFIMLFLPLVSCLACLFLLKSVAKSSQKYQTLIRRLKKQGTYEEWADRHKQLVLLENLFRYFRFSVILLVLIGFLIEFASMPRFAVVVLEVIGYTYWP